MKKAIKNVLLKINNNGFEAYVVGGYPRDLYLGRKTVDVDVCTSARPKDLKEIFPQAKLPKKKYGSVVLYYQKIRFEVTTFRAELKYEDYRKPVEIEYIDDLKEDLLRRDFTINTLCLDANEKIHDFLGVLSDLDNKIIKTVKEPSFTLQQDSLRILRAVRFATILDFTIEEKTKRAIIEHQENLKLISSQRKREELDKIFTSKNIQKGIFLLIELDLLKILSLEKLNDIKIVNNLLGIWSQLDVLEIYPFNKSEKKLIQKIKQMTEKCTFSDYDIYQYGLYVSTIAAEIKGIPKKEIIKKHHQLPINSRKEIAISAEELLAMGFTDKAIRKVYDDLEIKIIQRKIKNHPQEIKKYLKKSFKK